MTSAALVAASQSANLLKVIATALVASVGLTFVVSLTIVGIARLSLAARDDHQVQAVAFGALAFAGLAATAGAVVLGITIMLSK